MICSFLKKDTPKGGPDVFYFQSTFWGTDQMPGFFYWCRLIKSSSSFFSSLRMTSSGSPPAFHLEGAEDFDFTESFNRGTELSKSFFEYCVVESAA